jgi:hypothetical protein
MSTLRLILAASAGSAAVLLLAAAQQPSALAETKPGLWEIGGIPGTKVAPQECISDVLMLARYEHRRANCTTKVLTDKGSSTVIEYSCAGGGFGHSQVDVLTPRSLRISTQGISDSLPFNYVLQARRVGDCPSHASASRH